MGIQKQQGHMDFDFFKQIANLHNAVSLGEKEEKEFDTFVLENKEKCSHPEILEVFSERMSPTEEYVTERYEMCKVFFEIMKSFEDWTELDFGLRTAIRMGIFEDVFEECSSKKK
ncbi:hypothetical protein [Bacillus cereus]|uniref:hypothetical protein n=1 Tax=Bacillus cereus TaxID=1396 RepID=UPI000BFC4364|nr:hypothetical protein [Bacillus cereus]PGR83527.1 hypothetical protein COC63_05945 [Bacillus cereus]